LSCRLVETSRVRLLTKRPRLKLVKQVTTNNGGTAVPNDWDLTATGAGGFTELTPDAANATFREVQIGVNYGLSETSVPGYSPIAGFSCNGGPSTTSVTLSAGQDVTCVITNDDQPGTIRIIKQTDPDNDPTNFNFTTTGDGAGSLPAYAPFAIHDGQTNSQDLDAGGYSAAETVPNGWILTGVGNCTVTHDATHTGAGGSTATPNQMTGLVNITLQIGDIVTCTFENTKMGGTTRTQGFWSTHSPLANIAWFGGTAFGHTFPGVAVALGDRTLCGRDIGPADLTGLGKVMGGFWSNIAKKSNGSKRTSLDKVRMQLLQQLLAAEMNFSAFGSSPSAGSFASWEAAFCGTNETAIQTAVGQADSFNQSGDNGQFTPGVAADAQYAKSIANYLFWDNPSGLRGITKDPGTTTGDDGQ